jgi:hypothetical protein
MVSMILIAFSDFPHSILPQTEWEKLSVTGHSNGSHTGREAHGEGHKCYVGDSSCVAARHIGALTWFGNTGSKAVLNLPEISPPFWIGEKRKVFTDFIIGSVEDQYFLTLHNRTLTLERQSQ